MATNLGNGPTRAFCLSEMDRHAGLARIWDEKRREAHRNGDASTAQWAYETMRRHENWQQHYRVKANDATD